MTTIAFADWLDKALKTNNLTASELARRAGVDKGVISRLINKERDPSPETLSAIAQAFQLPPEIVFRIAGLLPTESEAEAPDEFVTWLQNELRKRGWPVQLAAQYAGVAPYFLERILQDKKQPDFEVARSIAHAFGMSDILIFELAGLIPSLTEKSNSLVENPLWLSVMNQLTNTEAEKVFDYARFLLSQHESAT
jgi:transcriptional regulator with XRE-family HTH domain